MWHRGLRGSDRLQNDPYDFGGKLDRLSLQPALRRNLILLNGGTGLEDLLLGPGTSFRQRRHADAQRLLPTCFLEFEDGEASVS